jgi:G3E family GTPase
MGDRILRVKGLLNVMGENVPRVIHAVQHERYPDGSLPAWPDEDHSSRLVFIVRDIPRSVLEKAFAAFCGVTSQNM